MFFKKKKKEEPHDLIARKEYSKAIQILRQRAAEDADNTGLRLQLAEVYVTNAQLREAMKVYKSVAAQYASQGSIVKAIALYKKMLQLHPSKEIESLLENLSERIAIADAPAQAAQAKVVVEDPPATNLEPEETSLFRDLKPQEFKQIVSKLSLHHYDEDTIIVKEGDPGASLFMIVQGEVRVLTKDTRKKEVVLANLGEGEFFAEVSLLTGKPRTATIMTNSVSDLLELTRSDYEKIINRYPRVKKVMEDFHLQRAYKTIEAMIASRKRKA
jgi:cAMP-dependent protein kinase regulator